MESGISARPASPAETSEQDVLEEEKKGEDDQDGVHAVAASADQVHARPCDEAETDAVRDVVGERHNDDGQQAREASVRSLKSICEMCPIIRNPTRISAGAVANAGMAVKIGASRIETRKSAAVT